MRALEIWWRQRKNWGQNRHRNGVQIWKFPRYILRKRKVCHLKFFRFVDDCRIAEINVPVIPGIMPVINAAQIRRMVTMCGASFPVRFQKIIHKYEDNKEALFDAGMSYALSQIMDLLVSDIDGIHLYTMNNPLVARKICEGIRHII